MQFVQSKLEKQQDLMKRNTEDIAYTQLENYICPSCLPAMNY